MNPEVIRISLNYLLIIMGSVSAGMAVYRLTEDIGVAIAIFGAVSGPVTALLLKP